MIRGYCDTCVFCVEKDYESYSGPVSGGGPEAAHEPDNWTTYTQRYCHRYPKRMKIKRDNHWCGEHIEKGE